MSGPSTQAALATPASSLPHVQREPSKEDIELAQQLVNHAQGIQSGPQNGPGQATAQREESIEPAAGNHQQGLEPQLSQTGPESGARVQNGLETSPFAARRSLGPSGGGQMCR